jgi:PLD-like domain
MIRGTVRLLGLVLCAGVLAVVPTSPATSSPAQAAAQVRAVSAQSTGWRPAAGAAFNDPTGGPKARGAIVSRLRAAIRHTRRGATIRLSSFAFDRGDVANLLIKAHRRGVHVQMVVMDHTPRTRTLPDETEDGDAPDIKPKPNTAQKKMVRELGQNRRRPSFIVFCKGSCRNGRSGNLHTKIYSFSSTGSAKYVIMSTSGNLTNGSAFAQWNDSYTIIGDRALFGTWVRVFRQLKNDRRSTPRLVTYSSPVRSVAFSRQAAGAGQGTTTVSTARKGSSDAVITRLSKIGCKAPRGYGSSGRTVVRIIMYGWYGSRGNAIARKVASLQRSGCEVKVIGSVLGPSTASVLRGAGIPTKAADWDFGDRISTDGQKIVTGPRCYSHYKVLTIDGAFDGKPQRAVWTGSENWSAISRGNDEVTLRLNGRPVTQQYFGLFNKMWNDRDATHKVGLEPRRRPCATG